MIKIVISIVILSFTLAACLTSVQVEEEIVAVHAEVVEYKAMAMHFDYDDGTAEWQDAILFKILFPLAWNGRDLRILCGQEPMSSPWRKVGNVYAFSIQRKYLAGLNPEKNVINVHLGAIVGEIKLVEEKGGGGERNGE